MMGRVTGAVVGLLLVALMGTAAAQSGEATEDAATTEAPPEDAPPAAPALDPARTVGDLLRALGEPPPEHWIQPDADLVEQGRALVTEGRATDAYGKKGRIQSHGFVCIDCHNIVREDPDLTASDPDARLTYAEDNGLPFLPGTTLWGVVNRDSWFNDDYIKKYGSLVKPANDSLRWALQLCSAECSQGRMLRDWEMDGVLAYLWTLQITVGDLVLDEAAQATILAGLDDSPDRAAAVAVLKAAYLSGSPAHTGDPPADTSVGYGHAGDAARGGLIYEKTCLTCHARGGPGTYRLGANKLSYKELLRNRNQQNNLSFYRTIRYGTRPYGVPMAYMPFFTRERLSDQQIDDLVAFLQAEASK
jgi:mono/diheme cytochrome c family protein